MSDLSMEYDNEDGEILDGTRNPKSCKRKHTEYDKLSAYENTEENPQESDKKFVAPILIKDTHHLEKERETDKITFDEDLCKDSKAKIKFTKFDKNKNLLIFPKTVEDYKKILTCQKGIFANEKIGFEARSTGFSIIVKGMSYEMCKKHESKLKQQGIIEIVDLGNTNHKPNVCKIIVDNKETYRTLLEEKIKLGEYTFYTEPNVGRPTQCFNCYKFNHIATQCTSRKVCFICGSLEHAGENCKEEPKCANCSEKHHSKSGKCREFIARKRLEIEKAKQKVGIGSESKSEITEKQENMAKRSFEKEIEEIKNSVINSMKQIVEPVNLNMGIISENMNVLQEGIKRVDERMKILESIEEKKIDDTANLLVNIFNDYHNKYHDKQGSSSSSISKSAIKGIVEKHVAKITDIDKIDKHKNKRRSMGELFNSSLKKLNLKK